MSIEPHSPEPNDDPDFDNEEMLEAADENPAGVHAPETTDATEELVAWDDRPDDTGHKVPTTPLENEVNPSEELVAEGIEEAEREQRIAAADPELGD